jgi:hypothetical protein
LNPIPLRRTPAPRNADAEVALEIPLDALDDPEILRGDGDEGHQAVFAQAGLEVGQRGVRTQDVGHVLEAAQDEIRHEKPGLVARVEVDAALEQEVARAAA